MNGAKVNQKNNDNWSALHIGARKGQEKGIQAIIKINFSLRDKEMEIFDMNLTGGV
jgi:ankyrin repeat protein